MRSIPIGLLLVPLLVTAARAAPPDGASEREQLIDSLRTSCRQFSRDDQWIQLDDCHRAWFNAHEEQVWRLRLNPHAAHSSGPSS